MAISSVATVCAMPGDEVDATDPSGEAMIHAADKYSRELGARTSASALASAARQPAPRGSRRPSGQQGLPEGYTPLAAIKNLALLGCWPLLDDGMSACMPTRIISAMQRRSSLGDHEADAWLEVHARACAGDPEAQRTFGRICENGSYRAAADVQRAFFWYYRAGLQGDSEARRNAERLMHRSQWISPATMAEPMLIHPGEWRITAHLSRELVSASVFDLLEDGTASGALLGNCRTTVRASPVPGAGEDSISSEEPESSPCPEKHYRGGWAFDNIGQLLTIIFEAGRGERRWRGATWQIEIVGCKASSLFGRDRRMVGYTLERLTPSE